MGESNIIMQLGVGGIFAIMVIKIVLDFIKEKKNGNGKVVPDNVAKDLFTHFEDQKIEYQLVREIHAYAKWLKEIHDVKDEDGLPVWYVRRSLETAIVALAKNIESQTKVLERLINEFEHSKRDK